MAVNQTLFFIDPSEKHLFKADIFELFDQLFKRNWGGEECQSWEKLPSNDDDICVQWNKGSDILDGIRIRLNHTKIDLKFVNWVVEFVKERNLKIITKAEELIVPEVAIVLKELEKSNIK